MAHNYSFDPPEVETTTCNACEGDGSCCSWCHARKTQCVCKFTLHDIREGFTQVDYIDRMELCRTCDGGQIPTRELPRSYYA